MSIEVMTAVWDYSTAYGGDLLILLAVANYADVNGRAYPSVKTLAQRGRMTERNAQYCIRKLEALGELKVERNGGPHGVHVFQILLQGANFSGCKVFTHQKKRNRNKELTSEKGEKFSGVKTVRGETHFAGGVKPISPEPSLEPKEEKENPVSANAETSLSPSGEGSVRESTNKRRQPRKLKNLPSYDADGYQAFIEAFPLHAALPEAVKAWDWLKPDATLQALILADIKRRKTQHQKWADGYITHPATYLRGERWRDDIVPLRNARASPTHRSVYQNGPTHDGLTEFLAEAQQERDTCTLTIPKSLPS
jgi:hypothetical protein